MNAYTHIEPSVMAMPTAEALEHCRRFHWRKYFLWLKHDPTKANMHRKLALSIGRRKHHVKLSAV
jgi:hypothetical protein